MQKQQIQKRGTQRTQKSSPSNAYSPDYSSPMTSLSLLPARFDQASPERMANYAKENFMDAPLPMFQDRESQMIPLVTAPDSHSAMNCAQQVLSDMSDEQLIRQLQLNMHERPAARGNASSSCSIAWRSSNNNLNQADLSSNNQQPLVERSNNQYVNSPEKVLIQQHQQEKHIAWQHISPEKVQAKKARHSVKRVPTNNRCMQSSEKRDNEISKSGKFQHAMSTSNVIEHLQVAPEPHPYPFQPMLTRLDVTDSMTLTKTMPTDQKQTSPAISTDSKFAAYINTASQKSKETDQPQQKADEVYSGIKVQQFCQLTGQQNSTILEQPTQEQLQASATATQINRYDNPPVAQHQRKPSDRIMQIGMYGETEPQHDSESLAQIRLINDAMRKKFPSNYSPNKSRDMSGSLQDFSMDAVGDLLQQPHHSQMQLKPATYSNDYRNIGCVSYLADQDLQQQNRALTASQNSFSHAREAVPQRYLEQPQYPMAPNSFERCKEQPIFESQIPQLGSKNHAAMKVWPGTGRDGQLYKPILRGKNEVAVSSTSSLPAKLDFIPATKSVNRVDKQPSSNFKSKIPTPNTPNYLSPADSITASRARIESRASVRRNLESQLASEKTSLSPVSNKASPYGGGKSKRAAISNNSALSTMILKYANTKRTTTQSKEIKTVLTERRRKDTLSKQSPSPTPLSRTRNEAINVTRSIASKQGELANLQTSSQASLVRASDHQLQFQQNSMGANRSSIQNLRQNVNMPNAVNSRSPMPRANHMNTVTVIQSRTSLLDRRHSNLLDQQYQQQLASTLIKPVLPLPTRASLYQLRRVVDGMRSLDTNMFLEIERIKKPTAAVLAIARMSCVFFEALRSSDTIIMDQVETMQSWQQIQSYIHQQLTCQVPELKAILSQKIIALSSFNSDDNGDIEKTTEQDQTIKAHMSKIQDTFFAEAKMRVIRRFIQTSKVMKDLVQLIFSFVCLALDLERDLNAGNLLGLTEQPTSKFEDVKLLVMKAQNQAHNEELQTIGNSHSSRTLIQNNIELVPGALNQTNSQSAICASCSCHMKQESQASLNQNSMVSRSSANLQRSVERKLNFHPVSSPETKFEMQMQVFRTLDQSNEQQQSFAAKKSQTMQKVELDDSEQTLSVKNYTTVQLPKQQQEKNRTSTRNDLLNVLSVIDSFEQPGSTKNSKQQQQRATVKDEGTANQPKLTGNRSARRQFSIGNLAKLSQPKHTKQQSTNRTRQSSVNSGLDFVSVVRANAQAQFEQPSARHTPRASRGTITPKKMVPAVNSTNKRPAWAKLSQVGYNSVLAQAAAPTKRERNDISPSITPRSTTARRLAKNQANFNSLPQKRLPTVFQPAAPQVKAVASKHMRNTTLYKSTASAAAKQKQTTSNARLPLQKDQQFRPSLQRDSSANSVLPIAKQKIIPQAALQALLTQPLLSKQARKTRSQVSKTVNGKRSVTPSSRIVKPDTCINDDSNAKAAMRQQKRQMIQRNLGTLRNSQTRNGLADFVATEQAIKLAQKQQPQPSLKPQKEYAVDDDNVEFTPIDSVPSFGGEFAGSPTNDIRVGHDQPSTIFEEESSISVGQRRPEASFTPGKLNSDESLREDPQTPCINGQRLSTQQETAELGKYSQKEFHEYLVSHKSDIKESTYAERQDTDDRQEFIIAKAQAITENINSCYKQHNMPQIDMATIQKLKMRRLQFMHQACTEVDADLAYESAFTRRQQPHTMTTQQSYNIVTTETVETTVPEEEDAQQPAQDNSFAEALFKLKAEVESLMQR